MKVNRDVFCNSPWYELHIYWDGALGFCCKAKDKLYPEAQSDFYNIKNMSVGEWFDSEPMRQARLLMFNTSRNPLCYYCYKDEDAGGISRRDRCNQKSVIFTRSNFEDSFLQSPNYPKFEQSYLNHGSHSGYPVDLHVDLGNYCNLACKMCFPAASSRVARQYSIWNIQQDRDYTQQDWTKHRPTWDKFLNEVANIPNIKNVHFMGGEPLLTPRLEEFLDFMITNSRTDIGISFVTNGTMFHDHITDKLAKFAQVGVEISLETTTEHNTYQRQGTDTPQVLSNLDRYLAYRNERFSVRFRPSISFLTMGAYDSLIRYSLEKNIIIQSALVNTPRYLDCVYLPDPVKHEYKQRFLKLQAELEPEQAGMQAEFNYNSAHENQKIVSNQITQCINLLEMPMPRDAEQQHKLLVSWCRKWDDLYGYDARNLYPELRDLFEKYGY